MWVLEMNQSLLFLYTIFFLWLGQSATSQLTAVDPVASNIEDHIREFFPDTSLISEAGVLSGGSRQRSISK